MGLYDDDDAAVTKGDICDIDYWNAKAFSTALDEALKTRQPESKIGMLIGDAIKQYDKALETYSNHEDLLAWKAKAEEIKGKIDPDARHENYKADFPWANNNYWQGWAALRHARMAKEASDWLKAFESARSVSSRWYHCEQDAKRRWTEEMSKQFTEEYAEAKELQSEASKRK